MKPEELHEARTNPDFLEYLEVKEKEVMESRDIAGLYELLDSLLVLDLDEERVHNVYQEILKVAFDNIETRLKDEKKLSLDDDDIYFIRSFYEHAIEKWSMGNFKGAKELFFILTQICEDEFLVEALNVHLIACAKQSDMDEYYDKNVAEEQTYTEEKYGYFILDFNFDKKEYLNNNLKLLQEQFEELKHLLN
ncbi:hypothetical protein ALC152_10990 [Arcobacter sp. 15-2]|uniref:hypothetical protein n=1 Tax=Arcobacter sp. 15-2 TaxID=3374109 RepID=UPI00399C6C08